MYPHYYKSKKHKLRFLSRKLEHLIATEKGAGIKIQHLIDKIQKLLIETRQYVSRSEMKKILGAAIFSLFLMPIAKMNAQTTFAEPVTDPFGLTTSTYLMAHQFVDLDGDGDYDLLGNDAEYGTWMYFENSGDVNSPAFEQPVENPFGLVSMGYFTLPNMVDLDNDGDFDILGGTYDAFIFIENIGNQTNPNFSDSIQTNPFNLMVRQGYYAIPTTADLDGDSDIDVLNFDYELPWDYFENAGTLSEPDYLPAVSNPFGLSALPGDAYSLPLLADIDGDGDFDLLTVDYYNTAFHFYENTGTVNAPQFIEPVTNPFNLSGGTLSYTSLIDGADLDKDGDIDLLLFNYNDYSNEVRFYYYENTSVVSTSDIINSAEIKVFPNPTNAHIYIESDKSFTSIVIMDVFGSTLSKQSFLNKVNIDQLPSGTYLMKLTDKEGQSYIEKIVKK